MEIENFYLRKMVNDYLGTNKDKFSQDDLKQIVSLKIDEATDISELISFSFLKELTIYNKYISFKEFDTLNKLLKLDTIYFINCQIDNLNILKKSIKSFYFENCSIENISDLNNQDKLKSLYLDNMEFINLNDISVIRQIENLSFHNTPILNEEKLIYLDNIKCLDIYNTGTKNLSIFLTMDTLKILVIDKIVALNNKDIVLKLINKGVSVINEMGKSVVMYYE